MKKVVAPLLFSLLLIATELPGISKARVSPPQNNTALVLVVSHSDAENAEGTMDAVVMIKNGKFTPPYGDYDEASQARFAKEYFAAGKKYRLTFGGGEVGSATVETSNQGCNNIHATVQMEDNGRIPRPLSGLATDSTSLGTKPSARRAPTAAEREAVMTLVKQIYRSRGTTPASLGQLKTTNLTATDLNGDGKFEMVASFVLETKTKARRDLFLIAEPQGQVFKAALAHFQAYKLPPEGFDSAVDFVDQLDLDGDGVGEVFVLQHGFDAYGYSIYKKSRGRWRQVHTTTGDAC